MKLLVIGGGAVSEAIHLPSAIKLVGVENVFLAEPVGAQYEKLVSKFGLVNVTADYKEVLDVVDAVIIATPPHLHNAIIADCIRKKRPLLCEKPLSSDPKESQTILDALDAKLVMGMCHTYRLFPNRQQVRKLIQSGFFGNQVHIDIQEGFPAHWPTVSGYCYRKEMVPGGVLFDAGIHSLDFLLWCLGEPTHVDYHDDAMGGLESNAVVNLQFAKGNASFRISRTCELSNKIIVTGEGKTAELDVFEMNDWLENGLQKTAEHNTPMDWSNIGVAQLQNFIGSVEGENEISCPIEDGLKVVKLLDQCYQSPRRTAINPKPLSNLKGKKVLVTGGTGFIGSLMAERLRVHEQAEVRVMVHNWAKAAYVSRFDVEFVKADITDFDEVEAAVKGCEYVFHCVGVGGDAEQSMRINADGTENVVKACVKHNVKRVVYLSSIVVHGDRIWDGMTAEAPFVSYGDAYADAKIEAEKRFWTLSKSNGLDAVAIRPTYVWGPMSEWFTVNVIKQMKNGNFVWVDHGRGSCNAVYVENLIDLALICCLHPNAIGQSFLISDNQKKDWRTFYGHYADMLGLDPQKFQSIPLKDGLNRRFLKCSKKHLSKAIANIWERVVAVEPQHPIWTKWGLRAPRKVLKMLLKMVQNHLPEKSDSEMAIYNYKGFIDIEKNFQLLNDHPRFSVEEGMERTKSWLKDQNYLELNEKR